MGGIVIGSRGSKLALWQARWVEGELRRCHSGLQVGIEVIRTTGDRISDSLLASMAGSSKGLFVKEIEEALLEGRIDLAVHSLKDVPTQLPAGLGLLAIPRREDPRDALVLPGGQASWRDLDPGARVATSSLRRQVQLLSLRGDLKIEPIRGNVDTRLRKLTEQKLDGLILASAGLRRLGLSERISYLFPVQEMVPAVGQGALAVEARLDDHRTRLLLEPLHHQETALCVEAERAFLDRMGGGCQVPMGGHARLHGNQAWFDAFLASPDGQRRLSQHPRGNPQQLRDLALGSAEALLKQGAQQILNEFEGHQ